MSALLLAVSIYLGFLVSEVIFTEFVVKSHPESIAAEVTRRGGQPEQRTLVDAAIDARRSDHSSSVYLWPLMYADLRRRLGPADSFLLPLSGAAHSTTVYCDEGEGFLSFRSDRYGFNNPDDAWDGQIDVMLVGDSYALGQCVPTESGPMNQLRLLGHHGVSVGVSVTGTLAQYATFIEYVAQRRPKHVVWTVFENDLYDVHAELQEPQLRAYLEANANQRLVDREAERDSAVREVVAAVLDGTLSRDSRPTWTERLQARLKLWSLRSALNNVRGKPLQVPVDVQATMRDVFQATKRSVDSWGGELIIVYVPSWEEFRFSKARNAPLRGLLSEIADSLGVKLIDPTAALAPPSLPWEEAFPLGSAVSTHYSRTGYARFAEAISKELHAPQSQQSK